MTLLDDEIDLRDAPRLGEAANALDPSPLEPAPWHPEGGEEEKPDQPEVNPLLSSAAALLSTGAAGWMVGGIFVGTVARVVGVVAAALGAVIVAVSHRTRVPAVAQMVVFPVALIAGAVLVAPDATGGTANLPGLVAEAIRSGGLAAPPVPFDPGWRFLVVVLLSSVAVTASTAAVSLARPRLAVFLPVPVTVAAALLQPPGAELLSVSVALVLTICALAVAYGADLATQGTTGAEFEARRLGKAAGMMAALVAVLVVLTQLGLLLPEEQESKAIPPKRPTPPPPAQDRVIFTVKSGGLNLPWRLGVLDVYDKTAWMTPPYDSKRLVDLEPDGRVPGLDLPPQERTASVTFELMDLEGRGLPNIASPRALKDAVSGVKYDPRTQQFQTPGRARHGTRYTVVAPLPPETAELLKAGAPPQEIVRDFTRVPDPPAEVKGLLDQIPDGIPPYERLQFMRTKFYDVVVAAGAGSPVDVPPARVSEILGGADATPFEISATEALLARWAGIPARVGYGYYGGEEKDGVVEIRPKHGAMWLEVYFEGPGWVSIVGRPPQARSSLNQTDKIEDPLVRPTEELGATVYVPLRLRSVTFISTLVRYWLAKVLPVAALLALTGFFYVVPLKMLRRLRRRRWASRVGERARVAVAYCEFRDFAIDLNIGHPTLSPIEFLDVIVPDEDHSQLAWAVTRVLWGDLSRDCQAEDAEECELWARTLRKRLAAEQAPISRAVAAASRASLAEPYSSEIPNLWWPWSPRQRVVRFLQLGLQLLRGRLRRIRRARLRRAARRHVPSAAAMLIVVGAASLVLGGCMRDVRLDERLSSNAAPPLPEVPAELSGYRLEPDPNGAAAFDTYYDTSLAAAGALFAIRDADSVVQATLQTTVLKPVLKERARGLHQKIIQSIGGHRFKSQKLGPFKIHSLRMAEQRFLLAFAPDGQSYVLMVATQNFPHAERLFLELLAHQRGEETGEYVPPVAPPPDPSRGLLP